MKQFIAFIATCTIVFTSCTNKQEALSLPTIALRAVESAETSLTFETAPVDASEAVYLVVKGGDEVYGINRLFETGKKAEPGAKHIYTETGLIPGTKYIILAAAANESGRSEMTTLEMSTAALPVASPAVTLEAGAVSTSSLQFTLTPSDAEKAAFVCYRADELSPTVAEILSGGTQADPSDTKTYTVEELLSNTTYLIAAAASNGDDISEKTTIEITTAAVNPTLTLEAVEATAASLRFSITPQRAHQVRYTFYEKGAEAPSAEEILTNGEEADAAAYGTYLIGNLSPETPYIIAAVAAANAELSGLITLEQSTSARMPPVFGDFYYSDGTWSSGEEDPLSDKTCIGIVFYAGRCDRDAVDDCIYYLKDGTTPMEEVRGYVIALNNAQDEVAWGSWDADGAAGAGASIDKTDFRGYSNTRSILAKAEAKAGGLSDDVDNNYPATYYATDYYERQVPAPENSTGWFLPSAYQLLYLFPRVEKLQESFDKLGENATYVYQRDAAYWSSTEHRESTGQGLYAYYTSLDSSQARPGFTTHFRKYAKRFNVRSVLVF